MPNGERRSVISSDQTCLIFHLASTLPAHLTVAHNIHLPSTACPTIRHAPVRITNDLAITTLRTRTGTLTIKKAPRPRGIRLNTAISPEPAVPTPVSNRRPFCEIMTCLVYRLPRLHQCFSKIHRIHKHYSGNSLLITTRNQIDAIRAG